LRVIAPEGALRAEVPARPSARRRLEARLRAAPSGTPVVLCDPAPGSKLRCRRLAARAGVEPGREYLALPSLRKQLLLVEDSHEGVGYACKALLTVPSGVSVLAAPASALLGVLRVGVLWRLLSALAPGRVVIGRRA
jgi:hypothetical protein